MPKFVEKLAGVIKPLAYAFFLFFVSRRKTAIVLNAYSIEQDNTPYGFILIAIFILIIAANFIPIYIQLIAVKHDKAVLKKEIKEAIKSFSIFMGAVLILFMINLLLFDIGN